MIVIEPDHFALWSFLINIFLSAVIAFFFIRQAGRLTPGIRKRRQEDSKRWEEVKNEARRSGEKIIITRSDATTGANVIQQIPETSQPSHDGCHEGSNQDQMDISPGEAKQNHKGNEDKVPRAEPEPDYLDLHQESRAQTPYDTTSPNTGFVSPSVLTATAGAMKIAPNVQVRVNSSVEVSNATAAWIFGVMATVINGVTAFATRQTAKASKRSAIAGEVAANASKRSARAAEETCLIAQKHFEATVKDNQGRPPSPAASQNMSGHGAVASSIEQPKQDTRSGPAVASDTGTAVSPLYVRPAVLSPGLPKNRSGRVLRTMSDPTPGRGEWIDSSLDLSSATAEPKIVWPEVPTCEFGKPCNCKIVPKN